MANEPARYAMAGVLFFSTFYSVVKVQPVVFDVCRQGWRGIAPSLWGTFPVVVTTA